MLDTDFFLFLYDISNPKRLRQVAKLLDTINSMRIQKSVYEVQGDAEELKEFMRKVSMTIDNETDVVSLIPICKDDFDKTEFFGQLVKHPEILPEFQIL